MKRDWASTPVASGKEKEVGEHRPVTDEEASEAMAHIAQVFARFVDGFQESVCFFLDTRLAILKELVDNVIQAITPIYEAVFQSYRDQGAIYGDTHEGLMRWLRELSETERLRSEAQLAFEREQMLKDLAKQWRKV